MVIKRPDFLYLIKHERDLAVKMLWQFLGVSELALAADLARTRGEARGQLAESAPGAGGRLRRR